MRVIKSQPLKEFAKVHPDAAGPLRVWFRIVTQQDWMSIVDVRRTYPHADAVRVTSGRTVTVFNVGGGKYRLVTAIHYNAGKIFILRVLTHAEYDNGRWKSEL